MAANTPQQAVQAIQKANNGKYDYANMKSPDKNIQAIHNAKNEELKSERIKEIEKQQKETVEYTIIVSGINYGQNANLLQEEDRINIVFDAVTNYSITQTVEKTNFAVESGTTYSDHAVIKDKVFTLHGVINTSPSIIRKGSAIDADTDKNNPAASLRPSKALEILQRCVDERQKVVIASEEGLFDEFIITELKCSRDVGEGAGLAFDITLTEFRTFSLYRTVDANIHSDPKKSETKNKGAVQSSSKSTANPDKLKNEQTVVKKTEGFSGAVAEDGPGGIALRNPDGGLEDWKEKKGGGIYKPNVGLVVDK